MTELEPIDDETIDNLENETPPTFFELQKNQQAMYQELAAISSDDTPDEIRIKAREFAIENLPMALKQIAMLCATAKSDSTRLAAARTIWAIASSTTTSDGVDPITSLFSQLEKVAP